MAACALRSDEGDVLGPLDPRDALAQLTAAFGPVTAEMVACGIVVSNWRDAMEPLHRNLRDHEMAYINIATTQAVAAHCTPDLVDWDAVHATLLDPGRVILPGRTAAQVTGDDWEDLRDQVEQNLAEARRLPAVAHAAWAFMVAAKWWGMPAYDDQVTGLLRTGRVTRFTGSDTELAAALRGDPLSVPLEVWEQIVGGNGFDWLER